MALAAALALTAALLLSADDKTGSADLNNLLGPAKVDETIALLKQKIAEHPENPSPAVHLVELLLHNDRFDEADDAIKSALAVNAQSPALHCVQGDLLFREGHIIEADAAYKAAFHLDKQNPKAIFGISRTFRVAGLRAKAANLVRAAHELAPRDIEIASAFDSLDSAGSVDRWRKALEDPGVAANPEQKGFVETKLAQAKLLDGKHAFELASPYRTYKLPYRVLYDGKRPTGVGMTISINGVKSELRVDTGAGGVTVSSGFAARAGIQRIGGSRLTGIGNKGDVDTWIGYAESMQIGDIEFRNILVDVKSKGSVDTSGGLLGTDIFHRFLVSFKFREGRIDLDPLPGPAWDGYTPVDRYEGPELKDYAQIFLIHHMLLIPTLVSEKEKSDKTNSLFLIDTGASFNNISTKLAPSVTKVRSNDYLKVTGVSGRVKMVYQADRVMLQFASYRQTNLDLASLDLSHLSNDAGLEVSGILGLPVLSLFQSFTIDYRDAKINFDYKAR